MKTIHIYTNGRFEEKQSGIVREFPLVLHVNGREIATLISSPHDLRFLVAGFLRNQGFVERAEDFHMLAVCDDFGIANARIRGELPERLKPVLTSGCGTGVTFTLETPKIPPPLALPAITTDAVFRLMEELARRADNYRSHGGIHSAAVGDGEGNLLLFAEDIGRHNTLDRIAGEALFKGIDLAGTILVTSGRVSTEMAAKCARLGIALIASRTSATDMAVKMCDEAGIPLIGYVRGGKFTVYAHHERLAMAPPVGAIHELPLPASAQGRRIPGITGVILAGGQSRRMGSNKALLPYKGGRFIEAIHRQLAEIFDEVLLVTNNPEQYDFLPCRKVADIHPGMGALAGIHAGLHHAANPAAFMVACDMPYLNSDLIRHLATLADPGGVLIPESPAGLEPLHAVYGKGCLAAIETTLLSGERRIVSFFGRTNVNRVNAEQVALFDPDYATFSNINTPVDYYRLRDGERDELDAALGADRIAG
ncbi:formate dehydrogenase family accessory protein FdhD [Geobacter metallireducens RCH3]|uniref:Multifunctional fusion protein n=1 Tax=Geobacter metallireducens (strain ATCC 53774 / DSM 7210 / GS-15) TaxID=269799 RepID=Q39WS2_GEOMG|nr:formate dehydrogenase accessory sulfurtransferase FdhD [Geobacter metallireducens]ABB31302.1 formate dehydrogenase accessory protein FdhD and molybdopterin nucleotidyltransferase [Geobacter metallireducens GS-15]EHP86552.1 formate dehydrogenase family accessory protein FdhD [Geobacter metallireducens RCH3]